MALSKELEENMAQAWAAIRDGAVAHKALTERVDKLSVTVDETSKTVAETSKTVAELEKTVNYWVGRFGNTTGYITEMIIVPGIRKQMDKHGHQFDSVAARKEFYRKDGSAFAEADLLLENGKEVMIVEIKTHLTKDDVDDQVKRLKKLRTREVEVKIAGKSLISAVAGLSIDEDAKKMAADLGMYVIQVTENDKNIKIEAPAKGVGRW
ncbi:MAG: hypothetical protein LBC59_06185 [Chitinispirillales bacterium]|jgi:hypothetical protein|nr:hypothetical protein [Chitinispirillales bacterium]